MRLLSLLIAAAIAAQASTVFAQNKPEAVVYKDPYCGCCAGYAAHLQAAGYTVTVRDHDDMAAVKRRLGVPQSLESCHTVLIDGYVVEGHVPLTTLARLLEERPDLIGIALPGMSVGTPGMEGPKSEPFVTLGFDEDGIAIYQVE